MEALLCSSISLTRRLICTDAARIYYPMTSHAPAAPSPGVAIYLPRGPLRANPEDDESNISILRPSLSHPLVKVNYRWGKDHQYPTPIHDVASAFDFVISNLLPRRALVRDGRSEHIGRLAVCGELIGGQLATTMALTECRMGEPAVVAAAVSNPIANWTEIDEIATADEQPSGVASPRLTVHDIRAQRDALFRKPEHYFDPFASPTLFLRSAGINVPKTAQLSPLDDMDELAMLERDFFRDQLALSGKGGTETAERDAQELPSKKRKASRRCKSSIHVAYVLISFLTSCSCI